MNTAFLRRSKTIRYGIALFSLVLPCSASAQNEIAPKEPRWKQLSQSYGFAVGQHGSLLSVEKKFPHLAKEVRESWFVFQSSALGESVRGVEQELQKELGAKWPNFKKQTISRLQELTGTQEMTRQEATAFLAEVRARAKGQIPEAIRASLLSANPRYAKNPALEIAEGWKQTFRTKDHAKAKGIDFSLSVPSSWSKREGNRPNIIQLFQSGAGYGPLICTLMVKDLPLPEGYEPTKDEVRDFLRPDALKEMISGGGTFVSVQEMVLDGIPAGMLVSDLSTRRLDLTISTRSTQFLMIYKRSMINIQFGLYQMPDSKETLDALQEQYLPTIKAVASTFILNDQYM